jgi:hypothetical protein
LNDVATDGFLTAAIMSVAFLPEIALFILIGMILGTVGNSAEKVAAFGT